MSRREEVEAKIEAVDWANDWEGDALALRGLARTLAAEVDATTAERDRLAAENAELRKQVEDWKTGSTHEARYGDEARRELAAANATLDRLREVVPEGALCYCYECEAFVVGGDVRRSYNKRCPKCQCEKLVAFAYDLQSILYPQPENES